MKLVLEAIHQISLLQISTMQLYGIQMNPLWYTDQKESGFAVRCQCNYPFKQSPEKVIQVTLKSLNNTSAITKQLNHYLRHMTKANEAMVIDIERFVSNYE